jgi:adenylate kinase family enzyme
VAVRRIHVTGGPGSGKTRLARRLAAVLDVPLIDLDEMMLDLDARSPRPLIAEAFHEQMLANTRPLLQGDAWVSDGAYLGWAMPFFDAADLIVWMQAPWRVASYRIITRHIRADLARNNRFPGYRRLFAFWRWYRSFYAGRNPEGLNAYGMPNTIHTLREAVQSHAEKVVSCRTNSDIAALMRQLQKVQA